MDQSNSSPVQELAPMSLNLKIVRSKFTAASTVTLWRRMPETTAVLHKVHKKVTFEYNVN